MHKLICSAYATFNHTDRPDGHARAILFEADAKKPKFIWLPVISLTDNWGKTSQLAYTDAVLGTNILSGDAPRMFGTELDTTLQELDQHVLRIAARPTCFTDG